MRIGSELWVGLGMNLVASRSFLPASCPVRKLFANPSARLQESVDTRREWMQSAHIAQRAGNLFAPAVTLADRERVVGRAGEVKNLGSR